MLINSNYGEVSIKENKEVESKKLIVTDIIKEVRKIRADNNIMPNKSINLLLKPKKINIELFDEEILFLIS
jgi:valyl-tRNA synthetase